MDLKQRILAGSIIIIPQDNEELGSFVDELCDIIREQQSIINSLRNPAPIEIKQVKPTDPNSENAEVTQLAVIRGNEIFQQHLSGYFKG